MKREYHLSRKITFNMVYEIASQYKDSLSYISDFEIWNIRLISYYSGRNCYISYKYSIFVSYYDLYSKKCIRETLEINISESSNDGSFITDIKVYKGWQEIEK